MGLESPVGGGVHAGGGEGALDAQLAGIGLDVVCDLLQGCEVGDVGLGIAGLLEQGLVVDDAVGLDDVGDAVDGGAVFQGKVVAGQLAVKFAAGEIIAVILPVCQTHGAVDLEQSGGRALGHLAGEGLLVGALGRGDDLDGNAGLLGVLSGKSLPLSVLLGLEVQVIDGTLGCGRGSCRGLGPAGAQREHHGQRQH